MIVGIPSESFPHERRVALVPALVPTLTKARLEVLVQRGAGQAAGFPDAAYESQGARLARERRELFTSADALLMVHAPGTNPEAGPADLALMHTGQVVIGLMNPLGAPDLVRETAARGVTAFALELLPRISRAQGMDVLSSMATVAGYKAVLLAAETLDKMFPMLMTAAGTLSAARVFVMGAGVAGLQAIATAKRLGAAVTAYDVRPAVKEQVESLGGKFLTLGLESAGAEGAGGYAKAMDEEFYRKQREMMSQAVAGSDVVITTAAVPGKRAPVLLTGEMVRGMRPGSVIVDLAAESGGNCELTRPGETAVAQGVTILGPLNLASTAPYHASQMYARNVTTFLLALVKEGAVKLDLEDPIVRDTLLTREGEVVHAQVRGLLGAAAAAPAGKAGH
ncbi:MAG: Re/Si-specific NAD(P)(+) transhydrogenase subunit alpha [Planctomycetales bacterium]|nr:Re/Si-specific NAD(P)(+) transhydrogenase subunit alpha [Planctomycetales bacterium]